MNFQLGTSNPLVGCLKTSHDTVEIFSPPNSYPMPDMAVCGKDVFRMFKHIRSCNVEGVFWQMLAEQVLVAVGKPYLLEENDLWLLATENVRKIEAVSLESLQVERKNW